MLKIDKIFAITEEDKIRLAVDRKTNLNIAVGEEEKIRDAVDRQNICNCRRRKDRRCFKQTKFIVKIETLKKRK